MPTLDEMFRQYPVPGGGSIELPEELAAGWGLEPPPEPMTPSPELTNWDQVIERPVAGPGAPEEPAMPTPAELQSQLPTTPGTSGSLRVSQSRPTGRPDLVQAPPEATNPDTLIAPHAQAASIRTQGILQQAEGSASLAANEAEQFETEAQFKNELATDMAVKNAFLKQHRADRESAVAAEMAKVKSVDPSRVWTQASTFQKATGLAAAFLGGFMEPKTGKNTALSTIMQIIDNDIRAQETDIATQRENVYRMERMGERQNEAEESDIERFEKNRLMRLDALQSHLMKESAQHRSQITRGKYQEAIGMVADATAETYDKLVQIWDAHGLQRYNSFYNARQGEMQARAAQTSAAASMQNARTNAGELDLKKKLAAAEAGGAAYIHDPAGTGKILVDMKAEGSKDLVKTLWDEKSGLPGYAKLTADLKKMTKLQSALKHAFGGPGSVSVDRFFSSKEAREARQHYELLASNIRKNLYGAALTEHEAKKFLAMLPEPATWMKADTTDRYRQALKDKATEAQTRFAEPLAMRREDGSKVDYLKEWGTLEEAPKETRDVGTAIQKIQKYNLAATSSPQLVGSDTIKDAVTQIESRTQEILRGQDLDEDGASQELIGVGAQFADTLDDLSPVGAVQVRSALSELNKALQKKAGPKLPPMPRNSIVDSLGGPKQRHTVEPRSTDRPAAQDAYNAPELRRFEP